MRSQEFDKGEYMQKLSLLLATASAATFAFAAGNPVLAKGLSTYKSWDGSSYVQPFGCPDTTTYGQVVTIPNGQTHLDKFHFSWINLGTGSMVVRGEVYAWDGTKATGSALYQSKRMTISFNDGVFHTVTFKPNLVPVTPGKQYVLFASIDKDYEKCTNSYEVGWGYIPSGDPDPNGLFVYQNNAGDESQWTTTAWSTFGGLDLAYKASLSP